VNAPRSSREIDIRKTTVRAVVSGLPRFFRALAHIAACVKQLNSASKAPKNAWFPFPNMGNTRI
jgi:hypothetical protein